MDDLQRFRWLLWMVMSVAWPVYALALIIIVTAVWRTRRAVVPDAPRVGLLLALMAFPLLLPIWGTIYYGAERNAPPSATPWASIVLAGLALGPIIVASWALWRWRLNWLMPIVALIVTIIASFFGWLVGGMAIVDDWM